MQPNLQ